MAGFDSATAMLRAVSLALRGKRFAVLGQNGSRLSWSGPTGIHCAHHELAQGHELITLPGLPHAFGVSRPGFAQIVLDPS